MCGIAGIYSPDRLHPAAPADLDAMLAALRHRGPDESGIYVDDHAALGSDRLSIIDLAGGQQPVASEDGTLWIVYNGEVYNYIELRRHLEARGHHFSTSSDTEVALHMFVEYGPDCLNRFNGNFALAIWNTQTQTLFIGRDRLGIRPLYYTRLGDTWWFASEIKALLVGSPAVFEIDRRSLAQVFTYWSVQTPGTIFKGIFELPPGHWMQIDANGCRQQAYWKLMFHESGERQEDEVYQEEFEELLADASRIRMRSDVPVGAYLSGGLDSSTVAALVRGEQGNRLETFSISFSDKHFDESPFQLRMADALGTDHHIAYTTPEDVGEVFPEVIWHTETPVLRTAPAPMYLLSRLVNRHGIKVVMTGEGADEILAGYDIFKETAVRRFWARQPLSEKRPLLLKRLYPDISSLGSTRFTYLKAFFGRDLENTRSPFYSHALRWNNTARLHRLLEAADGQAPAWDNEIRLPEGFSGWSGLAQAQYLEITTFLSPYLLNSQGDRVSMANSVEGRLPFLDYRLVEFCTRLPDDMKLRGLMEKWLLKQMGRKLLPGEIWQRVKRPYRAPIKDCFFHANPPDYVGELLSERNLRDTNLFQPAAAAQLARKAAAQVDLSEMDSMAVVGILSALLVERLFCHGRPRVVETRVGGPRKFIDQRSETAVRPAWT